MYKCVNCKEVFEWDFKSPVRCPLCGYRIIVKVRPEFRKKVHAI